MRVQTLAGLWSRTEARIVLAFAVVSALLLAGLLVPGTTRGNTTFDASGVSTLRIDYHAVCTPGVLKTGSNITAGETIEDTGVTTAQKVIELESPGDVLGCLGFDDDPTSPNEDGPSTVLIDSELFDFANIAVETVGAIPMNTAPFKVTIQDIVDEDEGDRVVQTDLADGLWPTSGEAYIETELISFTRSGTSLTITARDLPGSSAKGAEAHPADSFVRLQGKLKLVDRAQPTYSDGFVDDLGGGVTTAADHAVGATVGSPLTQLTCRLRTDQTALSGPDDIVSRSRCYTMTEPGTAWADPYPGPLLALANLFYHSISVGTINDEVSAATTTTDLVTKVLGFSCFAFLEDELWIRITSKTTIDKNTTNKSLGEFRISTYNDAQCTPPATTVLGGLDGTNISSIPLANQAQDTDGDGCTDFRELGGNVGTGGLRDPYNPYDFFDANKDGSVTTVDIFAVAAKFGATSGAGPPYNANHDRGGLLPDGDDYDDPDSALDGPGPSAWNQKAPDGAIAIPDIFAAAAQFGHAC
jgi:hypothetical protein